jgi:DNA adenine methylase
MQDRRWEFRTAGWEEILREAGPEDFVYCDPPYLGRHADYYNTWSEEDALLLARRVRDLPCGFAVSMWKENRHRANAHIASAWAGCTVRTFTHFYHVGAGEALRHAMTEALLIRPSSATNPHPPEGKE